MSDQIVLTKDAPPAPETVLRCPTVRACVFLCGEQMFARIEFAATSKFAVTIEAISFDLTLAHDAVAVTVPPLNMATTYNELLVVVQARIALLEPHAAAIRLSGDLAVAAKATHATRTTITAPGDVRKNDRLEATIACNIDPTWLPVLAAIDAEALHNDGVFGHIQLTRLLVGKPYPPGTVVDLADAVQWPRIPVAFRDFFPPVSQGKRLPAKRWQRPDGNVPAKR